ncbi:DNA-3-methyladenine glycosylase family protein [Paenibacillus paridis]|uniref:DNA-3-methyladenine glycosylase family protein n=1 Tax=Paenibacillus paridis TaxID=2583376 RepID=UPI001121E409|nr:DNA-3-methyladenine glycosylase [Paenibacillus paridis]
MGGVKTKFFNYGQEEIDTLKSMDKELGTAMERLGKVERLIIPDLFTALMHAMVSQLISAKAAHTIWQRMLDKLGEISPQNIAGQTVETIQSCGVTMKKASSMLAIAEKIAQGEFRLDELHQLPDKEAIRQLVSLKGVGEWTAEMLLIHGMERHDVVSWGDIAIRRGMIKLYGLPALTKEQFEEYRKRYSPLGSIASIYLWQISFE